MNIYIFYNNFSAPFNRHNELFQTAVDTKQFAHEIYHWKGYYNLNLEFILHILHKGDCEHVPLQ